MKVRMIKKAPRSTGLALGRFWSLTHILLRRLSASSLASILMQPRGEREALRGRLESVWWHHNSVSRRHQEVTHANGVADTLIERNLDDDV